MTQFNRQALLRLLTGTTFPFLFIGLVSLASAIQPSDASLWRDFWKIMGAFIIAMTTWRPIASIDVRAHKRPSDSTEAPSR